MEPHLELLLKGEIIHDNDMLYFFGLYYEKFAFSAEDYLMDFYYPKLIKKFIRNQTDKGIFFNIIINTDLKWLLVNSTGENYFVIDFKVENDQLIQWPHYQEEIYDMDGVKFWLNFEALIELKLFLKN